ncbi:UPL1, partial [Symbiodinium microadriaticum]
MSPGYSSYLNQSGDMQWEKIERGENSSKFNLSRPTTSSYSALVENLVPQDLQTIAAMSFTDKVLWFTDLLSHLQQPWTDGHIRIEVRRSNVLEDSFQQMMAIPSGVDLHKWMRIHFVGEMGIDAGGLEREWFLLVVERLFDPSTGLFTCSAAGDALAGTYHINPISHVAQSNHLKYFQFAGRLLAKAVMEQNLIPAMLSLPLRKQLLSMPITFSDLEFVDLDLYRNLCWLRDTPEGVEHLGLVFAVDYQYGQHSLTYELKAGGAQIMVTDYNKEEFLELRLRHRMLDSIKPQLEHLLKGFYEVLPPELLCVFDYQELELLMCGLPNIDMDDWIRHTEYMGEYNRLGPRHKVVKWFWEVVSSFSNEERIRLLQFTTGCSRLPAQGFKALQSNDGNYRKFNLQSIRKEDSAYPRAHTCFNKLDLPVYDSKRELEAYLSVVINME